ncbi:MAG: DUF1761 domain-containing protein [Candidatus Acidiferrum sp.]
MKTNILAILVSAVVYWLLGGLWYGVLFSKPWMALEHISMNDAKSMNPVLPYIITFLLNLLIAYALSQICIWRSANTAIKGATLGIWMWIGLLGPVTFTTYMYEMRPMQLFAINELFPLVGFCIMGGIIGAWTKKAA